ncbi:hypothetical protein CASFOL_010181 [Castilleja foliolosa]|uniref:Uncharacterized protein n=1 Tax=Castilleja foliolosa TaxID=1961234 RepID=A0ABD3DTB5_9LAMI
MAGEGELQFPQPVIQHLQSFLTGKEAARTTIVSKSWNSAWLTRPNLDFDDIHFMGSRNRTYFGEYKRSSVDDFRIHSKKTIKRYEQSNLKIESFKLFMRFYHYGCTGELAKELIVKALRIGATRLNLRLDCKLYVLPDEVFGADNLAELSVSGCRIKLYDGVVIKCRSLESLSLDGVYDITIDKVSKIVSSCPCIEKFSLLSSFYQEYEDGSIKIYKFGSDDVYKGVEERGQRVLDAAASTVMAVGVVDNLIPRLRCLVLGYVWFKTLCLGDLLSRFPFLKDFTLFLNHSTDTSFEEGIQISNCSLELIKLVLEGFSFAGNKKLRVKFDVPSVRKFTFEGDAIPCLSFISTPPSREWESHVSIECDPQHGFSAFWFNELSELLTQLSQSKTHLHVYANLETFDYKVGDTIIQGLRKHDLENLTIDMTGLPTLSCYALFDCLFRVCRPKLITQYYKDGPRKRRYIQRHRNYFYKNDNSTEIITNIHFLCQTLEQGVHLKVSSPAQFMYGLNDLEEVNAQAFDVDNVPAEWRPIPLDSLDEHEIMQAKQRIRLLLKWKTS